MKLLFDQNISYRIIRLLSSDFPECAQVKRLNLYGKPDRVIWNYARENDFAIVTFDSDFADLAILEERPPKIIWLRFGNTRTQVIAQRILDKKEEIELFLDETPTETLILEIL